MRDLYDTRLDHPPVRCYTIALCPECGDEEIGQVVIRSHFERIDSWRDERPWDTSEEDVEFMDFGTPRYYCCYCGHEFEQPYFVEVEG